RRPSPGNVGNISGQAQRHTPRSQRQSVEAVRSPAFLRNRNMSDAGGTLWLAAPDSEENDHPGGFSPSEPERGGETQEKRCSHFSVSVATLSVPGMYIP